MGTKESFWAFFTLPIQVFTLDLLDIQHLDLWTATKVSVYPFLNLFPRKGPVNLYTAIIVNVEEVGHTLSIAKYTYTSQCLAITSTVISSQTVMMLGSVPVETS